MKEKKPMKEKQVEWALHYLFGVLLLLGALVTILGAEGWRTALAVFFALWGNNYLVSLGRWPR